MQNLTLHFHSDPGHGWLEVPFGLLKLSGIADKVSPFSYMGNGCAYLEEDCDMSLFIKALKDSEVSYSIRDLPQSNRDSFIRNLDNFHAEEITA